MVRITVLTLLAAFDRRRAQGTVNLYFHAIPEEQAEHFEEFLDRLAQMGPVISMEAALMRQSTSEPAFTISFDDGFKSTFELAGKILHRRKLPCTIFVAAELVGLSGEELRRFTEERLLWPHVQSPMSANDLRESNGLGIEIGSHAVSHKPFSEMSESDAERELHESKAALEQMSGQRVRYFAWPFGTMSHFPARFVSLALAVGYEAVYSGVSRRGDKLPHGVQPRRELNLAWGVRICAYLARRG